MSTYVPSSTPGSATTQGSSNPKGKCRAEQTFPRYHLLIEGEPCFLDIEFQKYKPDGAPKEIHRIGRIAILNSKGEIVLDVFAIYPREEGVRKCRLPASFGVTKKDLLYKNGGVSAEKVERWVANIVKDRTVVMHGGKHDLTAFFYEKDIWATSTIVDTQVIYSYMQYDGTPGLATLAHNVLEKSIQNVEHSPVEDADAMRGLYFRKFQHDRDAEMAKIQAERTARKTVHSPQAAPNDQAAQAGAGLAGQQTSANRSGSAKRRARKRNNAAVKVEQNGQDKATGSQK